MTMKLMRPNTRAVSFVLVVVLSVLAVRAVAGEAIHGFVDGLVVGFTDDV
jgi:heme/copper-type cytochrome/quinol oxidase subunit 4